MQGAGANSRSCYAGSFSTIYYEISVPLKQIKISEAIKQTFLNDIESVVKLYWLHKSGYNQLNIDLQVMSLPLNPNSIGFHEITETCRYNRLSLFNQENCLLHSK
jgi:hypothetical protein